MSIEHKEHMHVNIVIGHFLRNGPHIEWQVSRAPSSRRAEPDSSTFWRCYFLSEPLRTGTIAHCSGVLIKMVQLSLSSLAWLSLTISQAFAQDVRSSPILIIDTYLLTVTGGRRDHFPLPIPNPRHRSPHLLPLLRDLRHQARKWRPHPSPPLLREQRARAR